MRYIAIWLLIFFMSAATAFSNIWNKVELPAKSDVTAMGGSADYFFAATSKDGIYITGDNGKTWDKTGSIPEGEDIRRIITNMQGAVFAIGKYNFYRSYQNGKKWDKIPYFNERKMLIHHAIPDCHNGLYFATSGGLFHSVDDGNKWTDITSNYNEAEAYMVAVDCKDNLMMYWNNGDRDELVYDPDGDLKWQNVDIDGKGELKKLFVDKSDSFLAVKGNILYKFNKKSRTWGKVFDRVPDNMENVLIDRDNNIYVTNRKMFTIYKNDKKKWIESTGDMGFDEDISICEIDDDDNIWAITDNVMHVSVKSISDILESMPVYDIQLLDKRGDIIRNKRVYIRKDGVGVGWTWADPSGHISCFGHEGAILRTIVQLTEVATDKPSHDLVDNIKYTTNVDNATYNEAGHEYFTTLGSALNIAIECAHPLLIYNMVIGLNWEAKPIYIDSVKSWTRLLSNYLYDVTDGQLMLGKVAIYDYFDHWQSCDMRTFASTTQWPCANVGGINNPASGKHINMPRKHFGRKGINMSYTSEDDWLEYSNGSHWTTIGHEFGHYALSFYDEYIHVDVDGNEVTPSFDAISYNYGFMDYHYPNGGHWSTEMSNMTRYPSDVYKITAQWVWNGKDCWRDFEESYGEDYAGVKFDIIKPSDRPDLDGRDFLMGPEVDVGRMINFSVVDRDEGAGWYKFVCRDDNIGTGVIGADVTLRKPMGGGFLEIYQGQSGNYGRIRLVGANVNDLVRVSYTREGYGSPPPVYSYSHQFAITELETPRAGKKDKPQDLPIVKLERIEMPLNVVNLIGYNDNQLILAAYVGDEYNNGMTFEIAGGEEIISHEMKYIKDIGFYGYEMSAELGKKMPPEGMFTMIARTPKKKDIYIPVHYTTKRDDRLITGPLGAAVLFGGFKKTPEGDVAMLACDAAPHYDGLPDGAERTGMVISLGYSNEAIQEDMPRSLGIVFDEDLEKLKNEEIACYFWNPEKSSWQRIGGQIDTLHSMVVAQIMEDGTYALFKEEIESGILDDDHGHNMLIAPNPTGGHAEIKLVLDTPCRVSARIYNLLGSEVMRIAKGKYYGEGIHNMEFDASRLLPGFYIVSVNAGDRVMTTRLVIRR